MEMMMKTSAFASKTHIPPHGALIRGLLGEAQPQGEGLETPIVRKLVVSRRYL